MPDRSSKAMTAGKGKIPIIPHVIPDDKANASELKPNLNRLLKLLTDPHSAQLYDRHVSALKRVAVYYSDGFLLKDVVQIFDILTICADRLELQPMYEKPMIDMLKICCIPYVKEKVSDEMIYEQFLCTMVSQLGLLMRVPFPEVQKQICETLISFYSESPLPYRNDRQRTNRTGFKRGVIESSDVSEILVKALALVNYNLEARVALLKVLQTFSQESTKICDQMLNTQCARRVCSRLMDPDPTGLVLFRSVEILWNLLENGDKVELAMQLSDTVCIGQLHEAFIFQLTQGYSHYDRQLRNDLLVIATLVGSITSKAPFVETGFSRHVTLLATFQELNIQGPLVKRLKLLKNPEDFEFKKLLLNILVVFSRDPSILMELSRGRVIPALFTFVGPSDERTELQRWTEAQQEELQLHAMTCLCTLCPLVLEDYLACHGGTRLLLLLDWCVGPKQFKGQGNSFHGAGGHGSKRSQMRHCLRLMRSVISTGDLVVIQDLADQGAIGQLIRVLRTTFPAALEEKDAVSVEVQTDILFILSSLCENDSHRMELFGTPGVDAILKYLTMNPVLLTSFYGHRRLLLAAIDCIWCCIVSCDTTWDYFLEKDGAFQLMDLLEVCPRSMLSIVLGCLLDLCSNPKVYDHVVTWRGKTNTTLARVLCALWRSEEKRIGTKRDSWGTITDPSRPLMGKEQKDRGTVPQPAKNPSPAIVDVSENMRAAIYALLSYIGFQYLEGLTLEDHVTLTLIEQYLDFKTGEVWTEVMKEMREEGLHPNWTEMQGVDVIAHGIKQNAALVCNTQAELVRAQEGQEVQDEQNFYERIRENHRQKEKAIKDFKDFVARTSSYSALKAAKCRMDMSVNSSRGQTGFLKGPGFHSVEIPNLQTTTFSGRNIRVDSTLAVPDKVLLKSDDLEAFPEPTLT